MALPVAMSSAEEVAETVRVWFVSTVPLRSKVAVVSAVPAAMSVPLAAFLSAPVTAPPSVPATSTRATAARTRQANGATQKETSALLGSQGNELEKVGPSVLPDSRVPLEGSRASTESCTRRSSRSIACRVNARSAILVRSIFASVRICALLTELTCRLPTNSFAIGHAPSGHGGERARVHRYRE